MQPLFPRYGHAIEQTPQSAIVSETPLETNNEAVGAIGWQTRLVHKPHPPKLA
jgi:hypothetical protein